MALNAKKSKKIDIKKVTQTVSGVRVKDLRFFRMKLTNSADAFLDIVSGKSEFYCELTKCNYWILDQWSLNGSHAGGVPMNLIENKNEEVVQLSLI